MSSLNVTPAVVRQGATQAVSRQVNTANDPLVASAPPADAALVAPPVQKKPHGFDHFVRQSAHAVGGFSKGVAGAAVDNARGAVDIVKHPKQTARGVGNLIVHPGRTMEALGQDSAGGPGKKRSTAEQVGHVAGNLGLGIVTAGGGTALQAASLAAGSARSLDRVSQAGVGGSQLTDTDQPVNGGDVAKGAGNALLQPVKDTFHAVIHPKQTVEGFNDAAHNPRDTAARIGDEDKPPVAQNRGTLIGRGIVRFTEMTAGVTGPYQTINDAAKSGQTADRAAQAGRDAAAAAAAPKQ